MFYRLFILRYDEEPHVLRHAVRGAMQGPAFGWRCRDTRNQPVFRILTTAHGPDVRLGAK